MSEALKSCPFCGGEAEIIEVDYEMYLTGYAIYCRKCCLKLGVTGRLGEAYEWFPVFDTEAEAIAAWNARAERTCQRFWTGAEMICSSCAHQLNDRFARYCPMCGAKVVDA